MTTSHAAAMANLKLGELRQKMLDIEKAQTVAAGDIERLTDPNLSDQGLAAKKTEMRAQLRADVADALADIRHDLDANTTVIATHLDEHRPKISNDAASLMRSQMKWDQVRMRLEAGMPMTQIIAAADTETALAVREWAPAWLEAQHARHAPEPILGEVGIHQRPGPDTSALLRTIDDRLYETSSGEFRNAVSYARRAEQTAAGARPLLDQRQAGAMGHGNVGGLSAAINSHFAEIDAAARYVDPTDTDAPTTEPGPAA